MPVFPSSYHPILITGQSGQVGSALAECLEDEPQVIGLSRHGLDLSHPETVYDTLARYAPKVILNAAAYTAVDEAEEKAALALRANGESVGEMARYAFSHHAVLVHYSTDYVFAGHGASAWSETDPTAPVNSYGKSKLAGEQAILEQAKAFAHLSPRYLIFRTSWVYDAEGKNFVSTMLRLGKEREVLSIVADQHGAPSFAPDIAEYTLRALKKASEMEAFPSGVYHLVNGGETSWHGFAEKIFALAESLNAQLKVREVQAIRTSEYPTPARRPLNSRLSTAKLQQVFGLQLPDWQDALKRCMLKRYALEEAAAAALHHAANPSRD